MSKHLPIHVAVGVITNERGEVLITQRALNTHQGGLWEFPGGKLESCETVQQALARELEEELGLQVFDSKPLIRVPFRYPDKHVLLDVWRITSYQGEAEGREGQPLRWVKVEELSDFNFPLANWPIINAIRLPECYMVTGSYIDAHDFLKRLEMSLQNGVRLLQIRSKAGDASGYEELVKQAMTLSLSYDAQLLLNATPELAMEFNTAGVHLNSRRLMDYRKRPVPQDKWLAASVHNVAELEQALAIDVDFVVASPIQYTTSHPDTKPIGWEGLVELCEYASCPVYALGGMELKHIEKSKAHGAQGIAAISSLWGAG